jgi:hypothetical protein
LANNVPVTVALPLDTSPPPVTLPVAFTV